MLGSGSDFLLEDSCVSFIEGLVVLEVVSVGSGPSHKSPLPPLLLVSTARQSSLVPREEPRSAPLG